MGRPLKRAAHPSLIEKWECGYAMSEETLKDFLRRVRELVAVMDGGEGPPPSIGVQLGLRLGEGGDTPNFSMQDYILGVIDEYAAGIPEKVISTEGRQAEDRVG